MLEHVIKEIVVIELQQVSKIYHTDAGEFTALTDINLSVKKGEIYGVIGKSGAGKSTLIRCVNLLERPSSGIVRVGGQDLMQLTPAALRQARHQIGMVFQHFNLLSNRTVFDNVSLPLELMGYDKQHIQKEVLPLLELVGLVDKRNAYPSQLSGGQKQRVAIARALSTKPSVLLCDEMTSALDPETTRSILELIKEINQQLHLSILLITHEMSVIKAIADRVGVIDQGGIVEEADVFTLFTQPKTAITKSLVRLTLSLELPAGLRNKVRPEPFPGSSVVWRYAMSGAVATQPIINELLKTLPVHLNILQANLEFIHHQLLGVMVVAISGSTSEIADAKRYLESRGLTIEVMGYVHSDDWVIS